VRALIDTIFSPVLMWLTGIFESIQKLSVPLAHPLDIGMYLGPFVLLGPAWITFISTACALAFIYVVAFIVIAQRGLFIRFKDVIKWW
jgi:hypothetical protein